MQNKRFLGFTFIFSAMIYFSFSAGAWVVGDWPRPNRSSIPEFKSQSELGTKCECVLDGGEWLETKSGSCCDEPDWYCSLEEEPTCTPEPSCCDNEAYAKEHKKDCCAITEYANKNKSSCCEDEEFVKNNQSLCCEDETYASGHIEDCCTGAESEGDKPSVCTCDNEEYAKAFPEECSKCPEGGELGLDGVTCCDENGLAWDEEEQKYATISEDACGCPYGGTEGKGGYGCCKGPFAWANSKGGYAEPYGCGSDLSPEERCKSVGGELSQNCLVCCKGNLAMTYFDSIAFNRDRPNCCGCPEGGESKWDEATGAYVCCQDGKGWNKESQRYSEEISACTCPGEGYLSDVDGTTCCYHGLAWNESSGEYDELDTYNCGCPYALVDYGDGPEYYEDVATTGTDGTTCCYGGYAWNESSGEYDEPDTYNCGCPISGADPAETGGTCCVDGLNHGPRAWNDETETYDLRKPICGCPFNGEAGTDGETCCYKGKAWNSDFESEIYDKRYENLINRTTGEEYYTIINPACACPGTGKPSADGTTCCDSIYAWNPDSGSFGAYDDRQPEKCGCPNGGELKGDTDDNQTCCLHGFGISDGYSGGTLDQRFDFEVEIRSSYYDVLKPDVCGCPEGYTQVGDVCCSGAYMATGYVDESGAYYDSQEYRPDVCGCPEGGTPETNEYGEMVCCLNGYVWDWYEEDKYGYYSFRPDICKCPDGNESIWSDEADAYICCYDGLAWNEEKKSYNNAIPFCGCPWGSIDEKTGNCCYDGFAWDEDEFDYNRVEPETCGCPWWGDISKVDGETCCYDGHAWNGGDYYSGVYDDYSPELCGCPEGGTEKTDKDGNVVCCSGSNAFDPKVYAAGEGDNPYTDFKPEVCGCLNNGLFTDKYQWNNKNGRCDFCINHLGEGEKTCDVEDDSAVYTCQNGEYVKAEICVGNNKCVDGKCHCPVKSVEGLSESFCKEAGGKVFDEETCTCVCPADKPVWDGSECVKEECENVNDCQEEFPDMSISCLLCENKVCKQKGKFCDGNEVFSCSADGKLSITSYPCDENEICINGECKCAENPICQSGEKICEGNILKTCDADVACPYWIRHDCSGENGKGKCEDGQCKQSDCTPGETRCVENGINNTVQICNENGGWGETKTCNVRCKDGHCVDTECEPGDKKSGVDYATGLSYSFICNEQGKWVPDK